MPVFAFTVSSRSAMVVAGMRVDVAAAAGHAVLVVEEDEADADASEGEEEEGEEAEHRRLGELVHARHALGRADLEVDAAAKGEQHTLGAQVDVLRRGEWVMRW